MVRGLSDHLDLQSEETSPVSGLPLSKRASRRSVTPPPPPPPPPQQAAVTTATLPEDFHQVAPPPPPPPPPGTPPAQRNRDPPALRIVDTGTTELSASYRSKKHQSSRFHINTNLAEHNTEGGPSSSTRSGGHIQESVAPHSFHETATHYHGGEASQVDPIMQQGYNQHQHRPHSNRSSRTPVTGSTTRHQQQQQQQQQAPLLGSPTSKMLAETVREISTAASGTLDKLREWGANGGSLYQDLGFSTPKSEASRITPSGATAKVVEKFFGNDNTSHQSDDPAARYAHYAAGGTAHPIQFSNDSGSIPPHGTTPTRRDATPGRHRGRNGGDAMNPAQPPTILQDLAWPFMACGSEIGSNLKNIPHREQIEPQLRKVKEAVTKAVQNNMKTTEELWKLTQDNDGNASLTNNDDLETVATYDTQVEEENNQLRRLGSWGTINTMGTADTDHTSLHSKSFDVSTAFGGLEDDDGHAIDPVLFEKTQQTREKRMPRRKKLVKFDYPPISSLRQCPRPNPADLPNLFFTEGELDQIEDDRYSTMSTDDVEIVAVASKTSEEAVEQDGNDNKEETSNDKAVGFKETGGAFERDPPEQLPLKPTKGRPSTPFRHRQRVKEPELSGTGNDKRLVKGVQIFLRERSTGV